MNYKMNPKSKKIMVECLNCNEDIYVGNNPRVGNFITCKRCDSVFEIIELDPVMVDWPYSDDDDDNDEDLYDDE